MSKYRNQNRNKKQNRNAEYIEKSRNNSERWLEGDRLVRGRGAGQGMSGAFQSVPSKPDVPIHVAAGHTGHHSAKENIWTFGELQGRTRKGSKGVSTGGEGEV